MTGTAALPEADPILKGMSMAATGGKFRRRRSMWTVASALVLTALTAPAIEAASGPSTPAGFGATDLAKIYSLPDPSIGTKGTIALITAGAYPTLEEDLATYRKQYGLPECTVANECLNITDLHGGPPVPPSSDETEKVGEEDWAAETALDVEMASAACPGCRVLVVQTSSYIATGNPNPDEKAEAYTTAYETAARLGADAVSLSDMLGLPLATGEELGKRVDHPGVPLFTSIGDVAPVEHSAEPAGASVAPMAEETMSWPNELPWVVAVGGTKVTPVDASRTRFTEQAWPGLGGGCHESLPAAIGQPASIAAHCGGHRATADVSAIADPAHGPAVYTSYAPDSGKPKGWIVSGGTSASSPFVAGWFARSEHTTATIGPSALYAASAATYNDITVGGAPPEDCKELQRPVVLCQAGPGWDGPTGLGTPHGLGKF